MLGSLINNLSATDLKIESAIQLFLENNYFPPRDLPLFTSFLPTTIKLLFYFSCLTIFTILIKILHPYSKLVTLILISMFLADALITILIFMGFMQLLYG